MESAPPKHVPLQDELPALIEKVRAPAPDDPRFATRELIAANYDAFRTICHTAWKELHLKSIHEIIAMEALLIPERRKVMPPGMIFYFERSIQIWRRLNDALMWVLLGFQDHIIRTVCHRKDRPQLASANPKALLRLLEQLNGDPDTIAIWADATTCVDIGDIYCNAPPGKPSGFMEVKEGVMNDKIFELTKVKGTPEHIAGSIGTFVEENGPKALKQLKRFLRQQIRFSQVMDIVKHEQGFDPRREAEIFIGESHVALRTYDREIQEAIDAAISEPVLRCVDGCLWIYVDRVAEKRTGQKIDEFRKAIEVAAPEALPWIERLFEGKLSFEAIPIEANLETPEAIPLFLRELRPETVRDIVLGNLMNSVFLFLDWKAISGAVEAEGAELTWSSFKEGRRQQAKPAAQRFLTIGSRVPRIALKSGSYIDGLSKLYRIYFDGITPRSIISQYIEALHQPHPAWQADQTLSS
jgi:hypothetical protein